VIAEMRDDDAGLMRRIHHGCARRYFDLLAVDF